MEVSKRVNEGLSLSCSSFNGLLSRAFTGELTAEWEAANAGWIAAQQTLYERLPRLLILALIAEKAKRARRSAEVLVTALMKYVFLFQMEGSASHRRLYHFVPYLYGPFAKELYIDLEKLQEEGLVQVESNPEEDKMKITLTDQVRMEALLAELPEDLKEDAATVISTYGDLDHNSLLEVVYEKYPAYAKKSRLRQRRA
jgi:type I restriction enzyme S subunit